MDLRGYLGARERARVLGRWKVADSLTFRTLCGVVPFKAAFWAPLALEAVDLPFEAPAFGGIFNGFDDV